MAKYGAAARRAVQLVQSGFTDSPIEAWRIATQELFPNSITSQEKGCPRGAFLGLCEEGVVAGIPAGTYTRSRENKRYALEALHRLKQKPEYASNGAALWLAVINGRHKTENSQMDVVISLWNDGVLQ